MLRVVVLSTYKEWAAYRSHMALAAMITPLGLNSVLLLHIYPATTNLLYSIIAIALGFLMILYVNYSIGILAFWVV